MQTYQYDDRQAAAESALSEAIRLLDELGMSIAATHAVHALDLLRGDKAEALVEAG